MLGDRSAVSAIARFSSVAGAGDARGRPPALSLRPRARRDAWFGATCRRCGETALRFAAAIRPDPATAPAGDRNSRAEQCAHECADATAAAKGAGASPPTETTGGDTIRSSSLWLEGGGVARGERTNNAQTRRASQVSRAAMLLRLLGEAIVLCRGTEGAGGGLVQKNSAGRAASSEPWPVARSGA